MPDIVNGGSVEKLPLRILTEDPSTWKGASLQSVSQLTAKGLQLLFQISREMKELVQNQGGDTRLKHRVLATVFYEASTRTACSFQAAMLRLGGTFLHVDGQGNTSAGKKGESLEDTVRCIQCYSDLTVLRHPVQGSVRRAIDSTTKPVVNAGDGVGEHPTQALLDMYTIVDELRLSESQNKAPLTVVFLGDLRHGRTVHSLAKLLATSEVWGDRLTLRYCCPTGLEMPEYVLRYVEEQGSSSSSIVQETVPDLVQACQGADVLYVTRVQQERFETIEEYDKVKGCYVVDSALLAQAPPRLAILHPLPRVDEIAVEVDSDPRAAYFRQMENGMFVRMALLSLILQS